MPATPAVSQPVLDVISPDRSCLSVPVTESPFFIGRGDAGNHLPISDPRISRNCAAIHFESGRYFLEDRGHRLGVFINGEGIGRKVLREGDVVTFGLEDSYQIIFHSPADVVETAEMQDSTIESFLTRIGHITSSELASTGLGKLNLLLEATNLLHSQLPLDAVLEAMLDHAIAITNAERGLLLEADSTGSLRQRLARSAGSKSLPANGFSPTQTVLRLVMERQTGVVTEDIHHPESEFKGSESIVAQRLRAVVAIPLYAMPRASTAESFVSARRGHFLGVLYLDSTRPAPFSKIDRQLLDAVSMQAASILDNARLVEHERQRQRLDQELTIARNIQQALLPKRFENFHHLAISGINTPCHAVGGDYFDVFPMSDDRTAFVIADVAGKGLGAALVTTMLQGSLSGVALGADPVRVFDHLNSFLCEHEEVGRYATVFFGILDLQGNLEYISAGHPSPILLRGGKANELFTTGSFPVGLIPEAVYKTAQAKVEPGDTLVLFSDGVTEAVDLEQKQFGVSRLCQALIAEHEAPLDRLQSKVVESVEKFARGASQADDITLLFVRYRASSQAADSGS